MHIYFLLVMLNKYTFIFEVGCRDPKTGRMLPYEYRKKSQMTISDARAYARRIANMNNVITVCFYKHMF